MKNEILITYNAAKTIIRDARNFPVETGGILVGSFDERMTMIIAAGESGINSIHHAVQYTSDAESDGNCLEEARKKFGDKIIPVGWWHKHPGGMDMPSSGDCIQVQKLATEYNDGKPILMAIVNRDESKRRIKTSLKFYSLSSDGKLLKHGWKLVKSNDENLLAVINAMPGRPEINNAEFWRNEDFQFYLNYIGRKRIRDEIRQLKNAGWNVVTMRGKSSGILTMEVTDGKLKISFRFPPEYPLNPPTVKVEDRGKRWPKNVPNWNSLKTLSDIANKIKEYYYDCHLVEQLYNIF